MARVGVTLSIPLLVVIIPSLLSINKPKLDLTFQGSFLSIVSLFFPIYLYKDGTATSDQYSLNAQIVPSQLNPQLEYIPRARQRPHIALWISFDIHDPTITGDIGDDGLPFEPSP